MVSLSPLATGFDFEGMRSSTKTLRFEIRKWLLYEDDEDDEDTPFSRTGAECKWRGGGAVRWPVAIRLSAREKKRDEDDDDDDEDESFRITW